MENECWNVTWENGFLTQQVVKSRGHQCGDIELAGYLANEAARCLWCWTSGLLMTEWGVVLTLLLMDI